MNARGPCFAPLGWIGRITSPLLSLSCRWRLQDIIRTKEKLRNGELVIKGDQWPIFLYHGYVYDEEDPWNGLLRSALLVKVIPSRYEPQATYQRCRHRLINTYSRHRAQSTRSLKQLGQATQEYTV